MGNQLRLRRCAPRVRSATVAVAALAALAAMPSLVAPVPAAAQGFGPAPGELVSDEFDAPALDTARWEFRNPLGDGSIATNGSHAAISVPAGTSHDVWDGANHAPRLVQEAGDQDFEVELKFDSPVVSRYQMQGLVVEQDALNLVRLEFHHNGVAPQIFVTTFTGGPATIRHWASIESDVSRLRVQRAGTTWTVRYSSDGVLWTTALSFEHAMAVNRVGPFAGNAGSPPPAFTAMVDHFRVLSQTAPDEPPPGDTTDPVISGVSATPATSSATVAWTTDEPADSVVDYGPTASYGQSRSLSALVTDHSVSLSALACETEYHYRVSSADAAGNRATGSDGTFTTGACPSESTPGSDEFDGSALNTAVWRLFDPVGDASVSVGGGHLRLGVPAGVDHDLWSNGFRAPRVLRSLNDGDFEVEGKFDVAPSQSLQSQGLVAQADTDDLVRFDVYFSGGVTRVFAATFVNGQPTVRVHDQIQGGAPLYLRMQRTGTTWNLRYSLTGTSWTTAASFSFPLALDEVGVFAINSGSPPPAFTSHVDYFRVLEEAPAPPPDTTDPVISGVSANPGVSSATVGWATDEPADSVVDYGPTASYGQTRSQPALVSTHSVTLNSLACETEYHYRVSSADAAGNRATGSDRTFTTGACPSESTPGSDEFDGSALDTSVWRVFDPVGDASVSVGSGHLQLGVPEGVDHDLWPTEFRAPRVLRTINDGDFEVEAKYDVAASESLQSQGLVAQANENDLVRFDVYSSGGVTRVFAATFASGEPTVRVHEEIQGTAPLYLRMRRAGSAWTLRYSLTGTSWTTVGSFSFPLALTEVGVFAINAGSPPPAFTSHVDYFRVLDDAPPPDNTPPVISGVTTNPGTSSATVSWATDEPADARVDYGTTASYGQSRSRATLLRNHSLSLSSLACATTYHYRVSSEDAAGNRATTSDGTFATDACSSTAGPSIEVWHGDPQRFGEYGFPQRWLNVVGDAADPDGVAGVDYRLDGGSRRALVISPSVNPRIGEHGDFNIQLDRHAVAAGAHVVRIIATDGLGNESTREVELQVQASAPWPMPFDANWATGIQRVSQVVDGHWTHNGDGIRTAEPGYDRTLAVGDESWVGVDATVPVTVHSFDESAEHAGIGITSGWRGHEEGATEPWTGWPLGGLCFYYRNWPGDSYYFVLWEYQRAPHHEASGRKDWLELGTKYQFRMRSQPINASESQYSCKLWKDSEPEPADWHISHVVPTRAGSVLLVADYADVTFGPLRIHQP